MDGGKAWGSETSGSTDWSATSAPDRRGDRRSAELEHQERERLRMLGELAELMRENPFEVRGG